MDLLVMIYCINTHNIMQYLLLDSVSTVICHCTHYTDYLHVSQATRRGDPPEVPIETDLPAASRLLPQFPCAIPTSSDQTLLRENSLK
jgi:hypothetical protein